MDSTMQQRQRTRIAEWLRAVLEPGQVVEVRAIDPFNTRTFATSVAGELDKLAAFAAGLSGQCKGVYFTPNPLRSFRGNGAHGTALDRDIEKRNWVLIDGDSVRPKDANATEAERQAVAKMMEVIRVTLVESGIRGIVVGDSGNGFHQMVPVEMPNDDESRGIQKRFLSCLQERFGNKFATVDEKTHNAARIWKLPGTLARKGNVAELRPHRYARLLEVPTDCRANAKENTAIIRDLVERWGAGRKAKATDPDAYGRSAMEREVGRVATSAAGNRNDTLNQAAFSLGQLVAGGVLFRGTVEGALIHAAMGVGLSESEARTTVRSGLDAGGKSPRTAPEQAARATTIATSSAVTTPPAPTEWDAPIPLGQSPIPEPFPIEALPYVLREYATEVAWALNVPLDYVGVTMLGVAGGAIGNTRRLVIKDSYHQSAALYAAFVARPGSTKSAVLKLVMRPLFDAEKRYRAEYETSMKIWEDNGGDGRKPVKRRCVTGGGTVEGIARLLGMNPRGIVLGADELSGIVEGLNQYKSGGKGNDRQFFLSAWDQSPYSVERVDSERSLFVPYPFMSLVGAIQPDVVASMKGEKGKDAADDGFVDRFLFVYPVERPAIEEQWRDVSEAAQRAWSSAVNGLLDLMMGGDGKPQLVRLDNSGRAAYQQFTASHAAEINDDDFPDFLRGPWSKLAGYCCRLSLILFCLDQVTDGLDDGTVDGVIMERAAKLVNYFKSHVRRVTWAQGRDKGIANAKHILQWLAARKLTEFRFRDLYVSVQAKGRFATTESLRTTLDTLVKHGFIRERPTANRATVGRPQTTTYDVHPSISETGSTINHNNPQINNPLNPQNTNGTNGIGHPSSIGDLVGSVDGSENSESDIATPPADGSSANGQQHSPKLPTKPQNEIITPDEEVF